MKKVSYKSLDDVLNFLSCSTPDAWVEEALKFQDIMLIDHANCEKKAASSALSLMYRYQNRPDLMLRMSKIAREELVHFEQVLSIITQRKIPYHYLSPSRYASNLRIFISPKEPEKLVDTLIIGALIEARSCERFGKLAPYLDDELSQFYQGLLASESRHFSIYLDFAKAYANENIDYRIDFFLEEEKKLILSEDSEFRFHSGIPCI